MKLANLDSIFQLVSSDRMNFVDVCGGPGGFSEYIFYRRRKLHCTTNGFGITLKTNDHCDWKLDVPDEQYSKMKFCYGMDGSGDLYQIQNINAFVKMVLDDVDEVQLAVADGGFQDARNSLQQVISCV